MVQAARLRRSKPFRRARDEALHRRLDAAHGRWRRLQGLAEAELGVVHQADARRQGPLPAQGLQVAHAVAEGWKDQGAVLARLGPRVDLDHRLGDQAEVALAAEEPQAGRHPGGVARRRPARLHLPRRRHQGRLDDDVLDVAVAVLLHAAGVGGDPAAEGGQLDAVRIVARGVAALPEEALQLLAGDPGLDAGLQVLLVQPQDAVHAAHVDGGDGALLPGRQGEGAADVGPAP